MDQYVQAPTVTSGHEPIETHVRPVWRTAGLIAGVVVVAYLIIFGLMKWFLASTGGPPANQQAKTDPDWNSPPQLQQLRMREQQFLGTYQWIDRTAGVARVPLERALQMIAEDGLPPSIGGTATQPAQTTNEQ